MICNKLFLREVHIKNNTYAKSFVSTESLGLPGTLTCSLFLLLSIFSDLNLYTFDHNKTLSTSLHLIHTWPNNILVSQAPFSPNIGNCDFFFYCAPSWISCESGCNSCHENVEFNGTAVLYSYRHLPEMLLTLVKMQEEVCTVQNAILWRGSGCQTSKWVIVFFTNWQYFLNRPHNQISQLIN